MVCLTEAPRALPKMELCVVVYYCVIRIIGREGVVRGEGDGMLYVERATLALDAMACKFYKMLCST
jgi:hypothetical protein